jgi:hypothetical protein
VSKSPASVHMGPMTVAAAFKAKQPTLLTEYLTNREAEVADFNVRVAVFQESVGGRTPFGTRFFDGGHSIEGYRAKAYGEELPAGWRFNGSRLDVVPAKRTAEGKEIARQLKALTLKGDKFPGAPAIMFADSHSLFPRVSKVGEDYYLTLSMAPLTDIGVDLDPDLWEPVKLSTYHAVLEQADTFAEAAKK